MTIKVTVLGAGAWGSALAIALARAGHQVTLWSRNREIIETLNQYRYHPSRLTGIQFPNITYTTHLADAVNAAEYIVIAISSAGINQLLPQLQPHITEHHHLICASKGITTPDDHWMHQAFSHYLGKAILDRFVLLSGPSFATEVAKGLPTRITLAANQHSILNKVRSLFENSQISTDLSDDLISIEVAGVLKNIAAIATGVSDGLALGHNARAILVSQAFTEMHHLTNALNGDSNQLRCVGGIGDLFLTTSSMQSRNYRYGQALASGQSPQCIHHGIGEVIEGVDNAISLTKIATAHQLLLPLCEIVKATIHTTTVTQISKQLMTLLLPSKTDTSDKECATKKAKIT